MSQSILAVVIFIVTVLAHDKVITAFARGLQTEPSATSKHHYFFDETSDANFYHRPGVLHAAQERDMALCHYIPRDWCHSDFRLSKISLLMSPQPRQFAWNNL